MLQITIRLALALAGVTAAIVIANRYYTQALECLDRIQKLSHAAVPAVLAIAVLYEVIRIITKKVE
jgi:hypothetical protein